jgi:DNA-binding SARP family transcriptional activator
MKWRRKTASLVKLLALAHRLHCERVLESLWPELPARAAANNLHYTLHLARHSLGNPPDLFLRFTDKVLVLWPSHEVRVDVDAFITGAAMARMVET